MSGTACSQLSQKSIDRLLRLIPDSFQENDLVKKKCKDCDEISCGLNKAMIITRDATLKILEKKTLAELIDIPNG